MSTRKIQKIYKKLSKIPHLNQGGCLIGAYAVYKSLINNRKLNIVSLDWNHEHNTKFLNKEQKNAKSACHFAISMDGGLTCYDSSGCLISSFKIFEKLVIPRSITYKFCKSALIHGGWNPTFCRISGIPLIEKKLKLNLNETIR